jgi:hypothetical protein
MSRITKNRRAILRAAAAHERGLVTQWINTGLEGVSWRRNAEWLVAEGLLVPYHHGGWEITAAGREKLKEPFRTANDAHDAAGNLVRDESVEGGRGAPMGWAVIRCHGGGFAVRVGFPRGPSVLLPEGVDKDLLR